MQNAGVFVLLGVLTLAGCDTVRPERIVLEKGPPPTRQAVEAALARMPGESERAFRMTLHIKGKKITASGILVFHDPFDFRMTATDEEGQPLFDARYNWAGLALRQLAPRLDRAVISDMVRDFSLALRPPFSLDGLRSRDHAAELERTDAKEVRYRWTFGPSGRLAAVTFELGAFDRAEAQFPAYDNRGWPRDMTLYRFWRGYTLFLTFTDAPL